FHGFAYCTFRVPKRELKKEFVLATRFDSLPENSQTSPGICFVTNLRLPSTVTARANFCTKLPAEILFRRGASLNNVRATSFDHLVRAATLEPKVVHAWSGPTLFYRGTLCPEACWACSCWPARPTAMRPQGPLESPWRPFFFQIRNRFLFMQSSL